MSINISDLSPVTETITLPHQGRMRVIVVDQTEDFIHFLSVEKFLALFGECDFRHASLLAKDNGVMGYQDLFDEWKAKGIIT